MRNQRGFTVINLLIIVMISLVIAAMVIPEYQAAAARSNSKTYLGVEIPSYSLTADQKAVLEPVVKKRLQELAKAESDLTAFRQLPFALSPEQAAERLKELAAITERVQFYHEAQKVAKKFGFLGKNE